MRMMVVVVAMVMGGMLGMAHGSEEAPLPVPIEGVEADVIAQSGHGRDTRTTTQREQDFYNCMTADNGCMAAGSTCEIGCPAPGGGSSCMSRCDAIVALCTGSCRTWAGL